MSDPTAFPPPSNEPPQPGGSYGVPPQSGGGYGVPPQMPPPGGGYGYGNPMGPAPANNLALAIVSLLCCWPIGIPAVVFAAQVNGKWAQGDQAGAMEAAAKAKKFAMIALVLGIVGSVLYFLFAVVLASRGVTPPSTP